MKTHRPRQAFHWLPSLLGYFSFSIIFIIFLVLVRLECVSPSVGSKAARCSDQDSASPNGVNTTVALDLGLGYHKGGQRTASVTGGILRWGCLDESTVVDLCLDNKAIV